jgi:hypothetical protein
MLDRKLYLGYTMAMKTAISLPDPLFDAADRLAKRLRMSRSELYARAVEAYLRAHEHDGVTETLDALYSKQPSALDPAVKRSRNRVLRRDAW